jgi:drug/metabolite transporter (DMT)-like permease
VRRSATAPAFKNIVRRRDIVAVVRSLSAVLIAVTLWASAFACSEFAVHAVPDQVAASLRFDGAALLLLAVDRVRRVRGGARLTGAGKRGVVWLGVLGIFGYNVLLFGGLTAAPAADASVIVPTLSPVITAVAIAVSRRCPPTPAHLGGFGLAIVGSVLFLAGPATEASSRRLLGDLVFVLAAASWAAYSIRTKAMLEQVEPLRLTTYATVAGAILLAGYAAPALAQVNWAQLSPSFWLNQAYLAVFPTALANPLYSYGVGRIGPARATTLMFLVPTGGLAWSYLLLGETINASQAGAVVLMLVGAWLATSAQRVSSASLR